MYFTLTPQALPRLRDQVPTSFWVPKKLEDSITPKQMPLLQISCHPFILLVELVAWMTIACLISTTWASDMIRPSVFLSKSPTLWSVTLIQWLMLLVKKIICNFLILIFNLTLKLTYRVLLIASCSHVLQPMVVRRGDGERYATS